METRSSPGHYKPDFFSLPLELRQHIYSLLIDVSLTKITVLTRPHPALSLVNRQLRAEVLVFYYSTGTFSVPPGRRFKDFIARYDLRDPKCPLSFLRRIRVFVDLVELTGKVPLRPPGVKKTVRSVLFGVEVGERGQGVKTQQGERLGLFPWEESRLERAVEELAIDEEGVGVVDGLSLVRFAVRARWIVGSG